MFRYVIIREDAYAILKAECSLIYFVRPQMILNHDRDLISGWFCNKLLQFSYTNYVHIEIEKYSKILTSLQKFSTCS